MSKSSEIESSMTCTPVLPIETTTFAKVRDAARRMILVVDGKGSFCETFEVGGSFSLLSLGDSFGFSVEAFEGGDMLVSRLEIADM
jgi:hypothetical protein